MPHKSHSLDIIFEHLVDKRSNLFIALLALKLFKRVIALNWYNCLLIVRFNIFVKSGQILDKAHCVAVEGESLSVSQTNTGSTSDISIVCTVNTEGTDAGSVYVNWEIDGNYLLLM